MPKEKKRTGKYCVAAGCMSTYADTISVHKFPKEIKRDNRRKMNKFCSNKVLSFQSAIEIFGSM